MTTIKATKYVTMDEISEVIDAIKTYGKENVNLSDPYEILCSAIQKTINSNEWYELFSIANNKFLGSLISEVFTNDNYTQAFANAFELSTEEFVNKLTELVIERDIELSRVSPLTSIEHLNKLAETDLINLYYVEHVQSIDLEFVKKYVDSLDISAVRRNNKKTDVREFIDELDS